jgi:excisionase family DNA binding protein
MSWIEEMDEQIAGATGQERVVLAGVLSARVSLLLAHMLQAGQASTREKDVDKDEDEVRLLDMPEVARRLGVPVAHARELGRRGEIPTVRIGERYVRVRLPALRDYLAAQEAGKFAH